MEEEKKRRSWFERIRRLFSSASSEPKEKPKPDKKSKSKRWLPGKLRTQHSFALPASAPAAADHEIRQAEDEQSKHAMAVALATAAAAEAAVAAAHAAAEVVRLTGPQNAPPPAAPGQQQQQQEEEHAAVVIQSAYRGYLARRALRALKGLVRLQALIRGQAVRRQTAATLRGLESLMRIQARSRSSRADHPAALDDEYDDDDALLLRRGRELFAAAVHEHQQQQQASGKGWDGSIFSKEEMSAMTRSREEAALKRVRALQYASLQSERLGIRRPLPFSKDDAAADALNSRWSWLEEWVGSQPFDKDVPVAHQSPYTASNDAAKTRHTLAGSDADRLGCSARRSFVRPRRSPAARAGEYYYYEDAPAAAAACSPAPFPGYMASTASAKAKFRSMSTPKERSAGGSDAFSEQCFPFADRMLSPIPSMSPIPSIASDLGFATRSTTRPTLAQRSPRVKGPMTPARSRSRRSPSHYSFGSEAALHQLQMDHYTPVR
ncbi:unnamed protein product [Urochloa decumbens]|uniref:DUF4005 domain-containing protein n=1 Tax=Urochloa decumbens TaxID=240449 RepID=A0ABC8XDM1_9POAL